MPVGSIAGQGTGYTNLLTGSRSLTGKYLVPMWSGRGWGSLSASSTLCEENTGVHLIQRAVSQFSPDSIRWRKFTHTQKKTLPNWYQIFIYLFFKGHRPSGSISSPLKILSNLSAIPQAHPQACVMRTDVQPENPQMRQDFQSSNIQLCSLCSIY